jgi:hypothetical protein
MKKKGLPPITVTAPNMSFTRPNIGANPSFNFPPSRPNIAANRRQFTNPNQLYERIKELDQKIDPLEKNVDFILSQLSPEEQTSSSVISEIKALQQQAANTKENADRKFSEQLDKLRLKHIYDHPDNHDETQKLERLEHKLATARNSAVRKNWENEYSVARRQEITAKQALIDAYGRLRPALNTLYLPKFYPDYVHFPILSQNATIRMITGTKAENGIDAVNLHNGFLDNKVEILVSDVLLTSWGSQFGHVAIDIGGVVYGRAPDAWDIRGKEKYVIDQGEIRNTIGYVIQLDGTEKQKLFDSVMRKIVKDDKYSALNHSCVGEIISSFGELGINIVDPRWSFATFSPADMDNFLKHSDRVIKKNPYPQNK